MVFLQGCRQEKVNEEQAVLNTLSAIFDAMKAHDIERSKELLISDGQYHNFNLKSKTATTGKFKDYITSLNDTKNTYSECLIEPTQVNVMGNIASITSHYQFNINGVFSHCGDEVFTFLKQNSKWIITGSTYTVNTEDCKK